MAMTSRKMMLVPLPLALQHCLKFTSDHIPTLTLLVFVAIQFVLNILHYIPAKYWQNWVDRTRYVLKSLLDRDYRRERYQIELLRQRLAEADRRNVATTQELDLTQENSRSLRERLVRHTTECDAHKSQHESETARLNKQLEAQGKLLVETEALLEALRAGDSTRLARHSPEDKNIHVDKIRILEDQIATLTKERRDIVGDIQKLQGAHQTVQDQCNKILHVNSQLQVEKEELVKQLEAMEAMERRLTDSRNEALTRLNQSLQNSTASQSAFDHQKEELLRQVEAAVASKNQTELLLQEKEQQLQNVGLQSNDDDSDAYKQLQEQIRVLKENQQATHVHADQIQAIEKAQSKVTELEAALAEKMKANDELTQQIGDKDEEITRLSEIIEHGDLRPHKLKKPRTSMPLTPPATLSHMRSNSIGSRFGVGRERQRTLSTDSKPHSPTNSPGHRAQAALPAEPYSVSTTGTVSGSVGGTDEPADTSMASSSGSKTLGIPGYGKHSHPRRKSIGTRQRLSSILGIHIGGEKDKTEKDKVQEEKPKESH